jgi:Ras of Complex, Roc, domain of DAPkinase
MLRRGQAVADMDAVLQDEVMALEERRTQVGRAARAQPALIDSGNDGRKGDGNEDRDVATRTPATAVSGGGGVRDGAGEYTAKAPTVHLPPLETRSDASIDTDFFAKTLANEHQMNAKLLITMFDFGGQEVFNVIHPFFLTRYGVYIVCFNLEVWFNDHPQCARDIKVMYGVVRLGILPTYLYLQNYEPLISVHRLG